MKEIKHVTIKKSAKHKGRQQKTKFATRQIENNLKMAIVNASTSVITLNG